jgi:CubicO group peptidase (beta-lactamase class C family)
MALGVVKDGRLIYAKGYGVRSVASSEQVDTNTLFGIASVTKGFTAAALGILVDEGKVKWDDKVQDYIPEFAMYDPLCHQRVHNQGSSGSPQRLSSGRGRIDAGSQSDYVHDKRHNP